MMLLFAGLMVAHWFGFTAPNIPESVQNSLLDIIMIGVGGYTVGRSAEKIGQQWQNKNNPEHSEKSKAARNPVF